MEKYLEKAVPIGNEAAALKKMNKERNIQRN